MYKVKLHYRYTKEIEVEADNAELALHFAESDESEIEEYQYYDDNEVEEI
tara:strand:+ start:58 stop:207 length:150 start_codon:yes stop_codon:yes gene_type:complete